MKILINNKWKIFVIGIIIIFVIYGCVPKYIITPQILADINLSREMIRKSDSIPRQYFDKYYN